MKKLLILATLVLIMSACATPCCWCQNNNNIKWEQYEKDCTILYNKIISDFENQINSTNDSTLKEYYQNHLNNIIIIHNNNQYIYDALLDIDTYLYYNEKNYYFYNLEVSKEFITYSKYNYSIWFNKYRTLK